MNMHLASQLFLVSVCVLTGGTLADSARNISSRGVTNEKYARNMYPMNLEQWQCGTSWNLKMSYKVIANQCYDRSTEINMCCAVHDDCYKLQRIQANCDKHFCECLEKTREWSTTSGCFDILTTGACRIVQKIGDRAYNDKTDLDNSIQYTPALNQTAKKSYKRLYTECPDIKKTLSNCAYNHMVCYLQFQPDRSAQTYEDCVDGVIGCLDESSEILVDNYSSCRAAIENTMTAIAMDSKMSGFKPIREARKPRRIFSPVLDPRYFSG